MKPQAGIEGEMQRRPETKLSGGPGVLSRVKDGILDVVDGVRFNWNRLLVAAATASGIAASAKTAQADTVYCGNNPIETSSKFVRDRVGTKTGDKILSDTFGSDVIETVGGQPRTWKNLVFEGATDYCFDGENICGIISSGFNVYDNATLQKLARLDITNIDYISEEGVIEIKIRVNATN